MLRSVRHVWVYIIVYAVITLCVLDPIERRTLCEIPRYFGVYAQAQSLASIRSNVLKAGTLITVWPFVAAMPARIFVETGCFSMSCFALACRASPSRAIEASSKLFWRRIFEEGGVPVPKLIAVCDEASRCVVTRTDLKDGIRKPLRSMYAIGVAPCSLEDFEQTPIAGTLLEERMLDPLCYRVCTLRTLRGTRVRSIFAMQIRGEGTRISPERWNRLRAFGKALATVHDARLEFAPLVGWDVMRDTSDGFVALEGNLGGSLGFHAIPTLSDLGRVDLDVANAWVYEVREAERAQLYAGVAGVSRRLCQRM